MWFGRENDENVVWFGLEIDVVGLPPLAQELDDLYQLSLVHN